MKFLPHTDLYSGWTFVKINENGDVLGIKYAVLEVGCSLDQEGKMMKLHDASFNYLINGQVIVKVFSYDKYQAIMKSMSPDITLI